MRSTTSTSSTTSMSSVQSAMSFLRRRFSDNNVATGNSPNGYMLDSSGGSIEGGIGSPGQQSVSGGEAQPRRTRTDASAASGGSSGSGGFFASLTSGNPLAALKSDSESSSGSKVLLVIDDQHTNWSKYFKGKKIGGDFGIRVEQAEFGEINVSSSSVDGVTVDVSAVRNGSRIVKSFTPHFLLVRQAAKSMGEGRDFGNLIIGFKHGGVPSVNSLHSQYNFMDKPWTFSQLIRIQKKLGKEKFPLVHQIFYPSAKQMLTSSVFPVVIKIGHAHRGMAKFKVHDHYEFQDVAGVAAMAGTYVIVEQFVDAAYDVRVQKIGADYKSYKRVSVSKNWKSNRGSAMLEEIAVSERHKLWIDACSDMFGGLDIVGVKVLHGRDGRDYITEVTDCSMMLIGERQEEDRRLIADLVMQRMQACMRPRKHNSSSVTNLASTSPVTQTATNLQQQSITTTSNVSNRETNQQQQQKIINAQQMQRRPQPLQIPQHQQQPQINKEQQQQSGNRHHQSAPVSPSAVDAQSARNRHIGELNRASAQTSDAEKPRGEMKRGFSATVSDDESKAEKIRSLRQSFVNLFE